MISNRKGKIMNTQETFNQQNYSQNNAESFNAKWHFSGHVVLERVLALIEIGLCDEADLLATSALLFNSRDAELWLVAGLARFQKGNLRSAKSAFKMSAWINDNALAREMLGMLEG
jgi:hypothetical protein